METTDVAVVGGGLGGLAAATLVARAGLRVTVLERAGALGGRAVTHYKDGFAWNQGAHALYKGGAAERVLRGLQIEIQGRTPPVGGLALYGNRLFTLPTGLVSLGATGVLGARGKWEALKFLAGLGRIDAASLDEISVSAWLEGNVRDPALSALVRALFRLTTFANEPARQSAGAAIAQLQLVQRHNVLYLDEGWHPLVLGAAAAAAAAGVTLRTKTAVREVVSHDGAWRVGVADGESVQCRAVIVAGGPQGAASLVHSDALSRALSSAVPTHTACLDVALSSLPRPRPTFALGIDEPLYFSVHSATARVAPPGCALVSTMKYRTAGGGDPAADEAELEGWLDRLQPGWRAVVLERRFLPAMVSSHAVVMATNGGLKGRPGVRVPDAPGVFVVGDWVGRKGLLLDASLASAAVAAEEITGELSALHAA